MHIIVTSIQCIQYIIFIIDVISIFTASAYNTGSTSTYGMDWQMIGGLTGVGILFIIIMITLILILFIWKKHRLRRPRGDSLGDYLIKGLVCVLNDIML